ncbi:MAG TPA: Uma2 family endonuclease [Gammaproteobacteria bacterium]|nr:Uma2 family endonuclease [Gammaproteobacteria bacterium]
MTARAELIDREALPQEDHYVHLHGVTWADYERILELRGDHSAPRITYLEGTLEIMSPSRPHDSIKSTIGRLVEVWCLEHDVEFLTVGSWTVKNRRKKRGVEPDECYVFSRFATAKRPDLAIEVVWTSGGIDKLDVYRKLGVPEVWSWEDGAIQIYRLRGERYVNARASVALRGIDVVELASFLDRPTTSRAIRDYRAAVSMKDAGLR